MDNIKAGPNIYRVLADTTLASIPNIASLVSRIYKFVAGQGPTSFNPNVNPNLNSLKVVFAGDTIQINALVDATLAMVGEANLAPLGGGNAYFSLTSFINQPNNITYLDLPYIPLNETLIVLRNGDGSGQNGYQGGIPYNLSGGRVTFTAGNPPSTGNDRYDVYYYPSATTWNPTPVNTSFNYTLPIIFN